MLMSPVANKVLNEEVLMNSALDDVDFAKELGLAFRHTTAITIQNFEDAAAASRWSEASRHAHSMKGSSTTLGLDEFGDMCAQLENWARSVNLGSDAIRPVSVGQFHSGHRSAVTALQSFANTH